MTPKEHQRLTQLRDRVESGTLTESDVSAFLMILREHVGDGYVTELSHHIAHSERDRGKFFRRIFDNKKALDDYGKKPVTIISRDVFTISVFAHDLNKALENRKLLPLSDEAVERLVVFIMSLLQGCTYKKGHRFAELSVNANAEKICLTATTKIKFKGREVDVSFLVLTVPNRWLDIGNPRANITPTGLLEVVANDGELDLKGFQTFQLYIEREPAITQDALDAAIKADGRVRKVDANKVQIVATDGLTVDMQWDGAKLIFDGRPTYLHNSTETAAVIADFAGRLSACVHDDSNAHWFLPGLEVPDDGFHCHWVGGGGPTCNKPM